jgi:hypothetical protein
MVLVGSGGDRVAAAQHCWSPFQSNKLATAEANKDNLYCGFLEQGKKRVAHAPACVEMLPPIWQLPFAPMSRGTL